MQTRDRRSLSDSLVMCLGLRATARNCLTSSTFSKSTPRRVTPDDVSEYIVAGSTYAFHSRRRLCKGHVR